MRKLLLNPLSAARSRWVLSAVLAAGLGVGAMAAPAPAHAQDALTRVLVDVADVVFNDGSPYYRYGGYIPANRLLVGRDAYGRPVYYRQVPYSRGGYAAPYAPRVVYDRYGRPIYDGYGRRIAYSRYIDRDPPYGNAYGYRNREDIRCDRDGDRCRDRDDRRQDRDDRDGDRRDRDGGRDNQRHHDED